MVRSAKRVSNHEARGPSFETALTRLLRMRAESAVRWSDHRELAVDHQQHAVELVAAAQDQAGRRDDTVHALLARQARIFLDAIERHLGGAAEHRKHGAVLQEVDGIVSP